MVRVFFIIGSASAFIAIALGAFAAHGLKSRLEPAMLAAFETGVRYHMYHALALLAVGWACTRWPGRRGECERLAVRRGQRALLRQLVRAQPHRRALARCDHAVRRRRAACRMAVPRVGGVEGLAVVIGIAFLVAGFVKGAIGVGLPTLVMGLLSIVMPPAQAAGLMVLP